MYINGSAKMTVVAEINFLNKWKLGLKNIYMGPNY